MTHPLSPAALFDLSGRHALVTGGSTGIGRTVVETFAQAGADVTLTHAAGVDAAIDQADAAADAVAAVTAAGRVGQAVDVDLAAEHLILGQTLDLADLPPVDILVLNASLQVPQPIGAVDDTDMARQIRINLEATIWLLGRYVGPMVARGWGRVIAISSVQEVQPRPEMPVYAATKAALGNLMGNLSHAHAADGVTFNTVLPGLVETTRNLWRDERPDDWEALKGWVNPMRRAGHPDEIAGAVLLCAAPSASFMTGARIAVMGG